MLWAPTLRARRVVVTGRGSVFQARARSWRAPAGPSHARSEASGTRASSPTVRTPRRLSFSAVASPIPHTASTGNGCRKSSSSSGSTTSRPSGLHARLATLARNFVRATPTETTSPVSASTSARRRVAISTGGPRIRRTPATSRKASSIEIGSTLGVKRPMTAKTSSLRREYSRKSPSITTACGHRRSAAGVAEPDCTPHRLAS